MDSSSLSIYTEIPVIGISRDYPVDITTTVFDIFSGTTQRSLLRFFDGGTPTLNDNHFLPLRIVLLLEYRNYANLYVLTQGGIAQQHSPPSL